MINIRGKYRIIIEFDIFGHWLFEEDEHIRILLKRIVRVFGRNKFLTITRFDSNKINQD
jgi:hypothetical protein